MVNDPVQASASAPFPEIPGYRLESVLGRGATGTVYRAVQIAVERTVALKVLHPELAGSKAVKRLQREARTTARLAHPGIVSAIDMGQVGGLWWYAMELVDGPALSALLREKGRLSEREALKLFIPLCEALEHAHEQGVVHRDIKPANILVDGHGRARLVDLGLAFAEDDPLLTRTGGTLGTPHYLSPEQARNPQAVDVRSDLWSLGATMYHALCGRPPFAGESVAEILSGVLYAHIAEPRELEPRLSLGMSLVLRKCLTRNVEKRYADPSELLRDLEALRERRAVTVSARSLDPVAGERERRRRKLWIAAGAALALALLGVLWWKPWAVPPPVNGVPTASEAPWPPLEEALAVSQAGHRRAFGEGLMRLDALDDKVPQEHSQEYWNLRSELQSKFEAAVREERKRVVLEYENALMQERDFQRAAELVAPEVEKRLASEFGATEKQRQAVIALLGFSELQERVDADERVALARFTQQINAHYDAVVLPRVHATQENGDWRDARALIRRDIAEVLEAAGIHARGLSPAKVAAEFASLQRYKVESEVHSIENAWLAKDAELARAVTAHEARIKADLQSRRPGQDAVEAIDAAYARELKKSSIEPDQMLTDVADVSHAELTRARGELKQLQEALLVQDAKAELRAVEEQQASAWKDRQYAEIAAVWENRLAEAWLAPVYPELELRRAEAALLQTLLVRASEGLKAPGLDSILVGTIPRTGKLVVGLDPLRDGFQLVIGGRSEAYALRLPCTAAGARLLGAGGIEKLAGLANDSKDEPLPVDRLARALFRMREGEPDTALRILASGPLPRETHGALLLELENKLHRARGEFDAMLKQREGEAQQAYNLIQRERVYAGELTDRIKRINDLLGQYGDTEFVREHETELRDLKAQLAGVGKLSFEDRLRSAYGADIKFPGNARAILEFRCGSDENPRWELGDWKRSSAGWSAERRHSRAELENETLWPRLRLDDPLDLNAPMTVEIEFEQPGPQGRFVASVAGVHLGFAGPADFGLKSQFAARAGGADALKELLEALDRQKGTPINGLERGKHYTLRIELAQNRGRLSAWLNDEPLPGGDYLRPEGKGSGYGVALRSLDTLLLKSVRIDAGIRK